LQLCCHADLGQEPIGTEHRAKLWVEHFNGDLPFVTDVAREIDGRHSAAAELALDHVPIRQRGGKTSGCLA
jgi:hypothetical protein